MLTRLEPKLGDALSFAQQHRQDTFQTALTDLETVRVCSRDKNTDHKTQCRKIGMEFLLLRSVVSTGFKSEQQRVRSLKLGFERWIETEFDCTFVKRSAKISSVLTWTSLTCGRAHNCCKTNAFSSMCLVLRVYLFRLIMLTAPEESQHWICCDVEHVSSALFPDFRNQFRCCRGPVPSQAPDSAATNSPSPLLSAIVDCFLLLAVIGYQPSLPFTHDEVPLTLNRSASLAQSASPDVNTEPSGARFTASRHWLHCHDSRSSTEVSQD